MYELVTFEITDWNEWFSTQLASWWLTNWLTDRMWPDNQNYKTLTGLIKNGVEEGRGRLPLPNVMVFAREAIKKGRRFQKKSVSRLWTKGSDPPPPLIFAEMSIGLKHKKSVSNLWIGRDPPLPPPYVQELWTRWNTFLKLAILAL